jgi:hypothetical protein
MGALASALILLPFLAPEGEAETATPTVLECYELEADDECMSEDDYAAEALENNGEGEECESWATRITDEEQEGECCYQVAVTCDEAAAGCRD